MPISISYGFQQHFSVSALEAYKWCTDFAPGDHALMGDESAGRKVDRLTERTLILTDTFNLGTGNPFEKRKLVQLYPEKLFWTCTHINGPAKYSQFLYQIVAEGDDASHIEFTGLFLDYANENADETEVARLTEREGAGDAAGWKLLAKAMEQDLCRE